MHLNLISETRCIFRNTLRSLHETTARIGKDLDKRHVVCVYFASTR